MAQEQTTRQYLHHGPSGHYSRMKDRVLHVGYSSVSSLHIAVTSHNTYRGDAFVLAASRPMAAAVVQCPTILLYSVCGMVNVLANRQLQAHPKLE